jgi:predicted regulator of Ras-like GTPase activity (Roadblock/LC7/MglB family)
VSPVAPTGEPVNRSARLDVAISALLREAPELEAAAVVSFDGLPMAAALPGSMDEDRVAAMSAALLSLGERAAQGLGRGELSQVYIEGESGTVFLVSCDDEAVLVAVAARGAKVGMMLYEVRRAAAVVAEVLRTDHGFDHVDVAELAVPAQSVSDVMPDVVPEHVPAVPTADWSSYAPGGTVLPGGDNGAWS